MFRSFRSTLPREALLSKAFVAMRDVTSAMHHATARRLSMDREASREHLLMRAAERHAKSAQAAPALWGAHPEEHLCFTYF